MALQVIINALARLIRWSPIERLVLLRIDDAADATIHGRQLAGRLASVNPEGTALIELRTSLTLRSRAVDRVVGVPRHKGYGFDYLWWGFIAVNLLEENGTWFASASLKISK